MTLTTSASVALALGLASAALISSARSSEAAAAPPACGRMIYMRNCSPCHGDSGLGDGSGAALLSPRPRDFSQGRFRLVSSDNGVPSRQDVFDVVTRGIVGSAMPPHGHLTVDERTAVTDFVLGLAQSRRAEVLQAAAAQDDEELSWEEALELVPIEPGPLVELPTFLPASPELLAEGGQSFIQNCAPCHDEDGRGRSRTDLLDEQGQPIFARDFTAGVMKGGSARVDLYRRIRCGMPGSPMPGLAMTERETWGLLHYLESIMDSGAQERLAQAHTTFQSTAVELLPEAEPGADFWNSIPSQWLAMAPLHWSDQRVDGFHLQVARDEGHLALRMVWEDSTPWAGGKNLSPDTATVRFSDLLEPQFFCPGREGESLEVWQWQSDLGDYSYEPLGVVVKSRHVDGRYELVIMRSLEVSPEQVGMATYGASLAFELRNGAAGDADRSQNLTVWHLLVR